MNTRNDKFSHSMEEIPPSGIRKFFEMLIGHDDVISLSVGEPDFPTPWCMREEAFYHIEKGHTSYTGTAVYQNCGKKSVSIWSVTVVFIIQKQRFL